MVKVSVIMPSLNVADYIKKCIESVISQTMRDIEILCVDAGSTDGTLDILRNEALRDNRIRIIEADKKSYGYQMNLGIQMARGEYIGIVETDDWIDPDMYDLLYRKAVETDADVVKGLPYDVYEKSDGSYYEIYTDYIDNNHRTCEAFSPDDDPSVHKWDGNIWNGIYKRDFLMNHKILFNESRGAAFQDIGFQQLVLNEASSILYIHNHLYHYRKVRVGASTWNPKCLRYLYDEYRTLLESDRIKDNHKKWVYERLVSGFFYEFEKALCFSDFKKEDFECPEAIEWFAGVMQRTCDDGEFDKNLLNETNQKRLHDFMTNLDGYISDYKRRMQGLFSWTRMVENRIGNGELVVFGCGRYGMAVMLFLIRNGFNVVGMVDNNKGIRNQTYYGLRVMSVDEVLRFFPDTFFMVANKRSGEEITSQLEISGVSIEKVMVFDGSNDVLCDEIMMKPIIAGLLKT